MDLNACMTTKYLIILIYMHANILEDECMGYYKKITDYESIANLIGIHCKEPKEMRRKVRKLLDKAQAENQISYTILPQNQDIEIVVHIQEPESNGKKKHEQYTCVPYNLMKLTYVKFIDENGEEEIAEITKDLKMYFIALFRYSFHKGVCKASNEQIALSSGLSIRKVQMLHKEAQRIGLIGKYEPSKGGYNYITDKDTGKKIKIGKMSVIPLVNEETGRYYFEDLLPRKKSSIEKCTIGVWEDKIAQ